MNQTAGKDTGCVLFAALSIYDQIGGIQKFNRRIVDSLMLDEYSLSGKAIVVSLHDSAQQRFPDGCVYIGCRGHRLRFVVTIIKHLLRNKPAIVFLGHANLAILSAFTRWFRPKAKTALFVHGIEVWNDGESGRASRIAPAIIRRYVDVIVSVSQFTESMMGRAYHMPPAKFRRLYNAVDLDDLGQEAPKASGHRLISVARLDEAYKGIGHVLSAVERLRKTIPDIVYVIVGGGRLKPELMALAKALRIDDVVHFRGELSERDLKAAYRDSDVFVLPSRKEGFGIVFLEAWKHGLPVVCGNADASPEVVTDGHDGLVVDPDDVDQLAAAVARILTTDELAQRLARNGLETARTRFSGAAFRRSLQATLSDLRSEVGD